MAATAGAGGVILHLLLSERAKLPHGDPFALDRVFLGEVGAHVVDEGAGDGGR